MKNHTKIKKQPGSAKFRTPSAFQEKIFKIVKKIPRGKTLTYQEVARRAGSPKAFRAVGNILNKNYDPTIPCHRVIRSDGKIGGYNRGKNLKIKILQKEKALPKENKKTLKIKYLAGTVLKTVLHSCQKQDRKTAPTPPNKSFQ
ncbi:MAG: MGMT family protein [Candidatus Moraniibacteriota bacterium]